MYDKIEMHTLGSLSTARIEVPVLTYKLPRWATALIVSLPVGFVLLLWYHWKAHKKIENSAKIIQDNAKTIQENSKVLNNQTSEVESLRLKNDKMKNELSRFGINI